MHAPVSPRSGRLVLPLLALVTVCCWTLVGLGPSEPAQATERIAAACGSPNPYLVTSRFVDHLNTGDPKHQPVIFAFRETLGDDPDAQIPLATYAQAGSTFGMAYDASTGRVYASAYTRRGSLFPPGGPGAILSIDLAARTVQRLTTLPAGPLSIHAMTRDDDAAAASWVGRSGLGDIELSPDGSMLWAANLHDGRIHRVATATGAWVDSFAHGGGREPWGAAARPFGLAWKGDALYHGVVESPGGTSVATVPLGHVYRSRADGTALREVATFPLDDGVLASAPGPWSADDQPAITGLGFTATGDIIVSLRNLRLDKELETLPLRRGDLLAGRLLGDTWSILPSPESFSDWIDGADEASSGALAVLPGLDLLVSTGHGAINGAAPNTAVWISTRSGDLERSELIPPPEPSSKVSTLAGGGGLAILCSPEQVLDPGMVATATIEAAQYGTATQIAVGTQAAQRATGVAATNTALAPTRAALATAAAAVTPAPSTATTAAQLYSDISAACSGDDPYYAMAKPPAFPYHPMNSRAQAVAVFRRNRSTLPTTLTRAETVGQVFGLAYDAERGHLYAAALGNGVAMLGVAGQGAIYRLDLAAGTVVPWTEIDAGPPSQLRRRPGSPPLTGFGDIEIDEASGTLLAVNNHDQRIYRFALPGAELLGSFAAGTGSEAWAPYARPFGLGIDKGWLYHGVITPHVLPLALVFRSRVDGSNMTEVARFVWNYEDPGFRPPGLLGAGIASAVGRSERDGLLAAGSEGLVAPTGWRKADPAQDPGGWKPIAPAAVMTDIEFRPGGNLILGLHNALGGLGGAVLPTERTRDGWRAIVRPRFYVDDWPRRMLPMGSLARVPHADQVLASFSGIPRSYAPGAAWYDNATGGIVSGRGVFDPAGVKSTTLGDVELLCPGAVATPSPSPTPTSSPTLTASHTPSPSPSASQTAAPTRTHTPSPTTSPTTTATPRPKPVYLPLNLSERCLAEQRRIDVVLVIDASSSMGELTAAGRPKLDAAIEAARSFLDRLNLDRGDQAAIVAFNATASLLQGLTSDRLALNAALGQVRMARETCLVCGVEAADLELASPRALPDHAPTVIVLTDGRSNPRPAQEAVDRAATLKARGVALFTIGLGADIDAEALLSMASRPDYAYRAPDAEDLSAIYRAIAVAIPCSPTAFWAAR